MWTKIERRRRRRSTERRLSPPKPLVSRAPLSRGLSEAPNSLESPRVLRQRPCRNHAESKKGPTSSLLRNYSRSPMGRLAENLPSNYQPNSNINENATKRWLSDSPPISSAKRKRPFHRPPGLPSLASPAAPLSNSNSGPQQLRHPENRRNFTISQANDTLPSSSSSGGSDTTSTLRAMEKTALQYADYASRRQAAAKAALTATNQISSCLTDLMGESNRAVSLAHKTRTEAANAAVRAEGVAKKVKEATDLAVKDNYRANVEVDEANAEAEEALGLLRRVKHKSKGKKNSIPLKPAMKGTTESARIESVVEVFDFSSGTKSPSLPNHLASSRKNTGNPSLHIDPKRQKNEYRTAGHLRREILSQLQMKMPSLRDAKPDRGSVIEPIRSFKGHTSPVTQIAAVDENRFISSSWDTTVRLWNADTGECIRTFRGHRDWVHAISVLDRKQTGSCFFISGSDDRTIKMWNVDKEECILTFKGHTSFVKALAPMDGDRFLSGSRDRTIKLFSVANGKCLQTFEGHMCVVSTIVTLDSHHFASGSHDNNVKYWNVLSGTCVRTLVGHTGSIKTLAAVSSSKIVSGSDDKMIRLWDVLTGKCLREFGSKNSLVFSLTYVCEGFFLSCGGNNIKLYHVPSGTCVTSYEAPRISLAVVRLDDARFVSGSDQMLHLWKF